MLSSKKQNLAFAFHKPGSERAGLILFFAFLSLLSGCDFKSKTAETENQKGKKIATVYRTDIYASEIISTSRKDSAQIVSDYLDDVATKEALFLAAQESGLVDEETIEKQTEPNEQICFSIASYLSRRGFSFNMLQILTLV